MQLGHRLHAPGLSVDMRLDDLDQPPGDGILRGGREGTMERMKNLGRDELP